MPRPSHTPPELFKKTGKFADVQTETKRTTPTETPSVIEGRVWLIPIDDIDTDMIFHNRYLTITEVSEMGQYAFDNLKGYEDFAKKAQPRDIIMTGKILGQEVPGNKPLIASKHSASPAFLPNLMVLSMSEMQLMLPCLF
jgi:hypothetical protein